MTVLIILESGAKCGTVKKILGAGVECIATGGHIREVDGGLAGLSDNFIPKYKLKPKGSIRRLREAVKRADTVLLAMDDDREGEAIAWHCCQCLKLPLTTKRMVFHAVTPECVRSAYSQTRPLAMNLVHAQLARVAADLLVGFTVSPKLWKIIGGRGNLSAGRCQTPALGLTIEAADDDREMVIEHKISGTFRGIPAHFTLKPSFAESEQVLSFFKASSSHDHVLSVGEGRENSAGPPKPFTTSAMQQAASSSLGWSPKKTMSEAGKLYNDGHITYPRTDKAEYSPDFIAKAHAFIKGKYGEAYIPKTQGKKTKSKHAQEAHEAVRVTRLDVPDVDGSPFYRLIWRNTIQSCMTAWVRTITDLEVTAPGDGLYTANLVETHHLGWRIAGDAPDELLQKEVALASAVEMCQKLATQELEKAESKVTASGGPQLLKEASLVKALERTGIGRPSTYASLVDKLLDRSYVRKSDTKGLRVDTYEHAYDLKKITSKGVTKQVGAQKQRLIPTDLGRRVYGECMTLHKRLFSNTYTADLERQLDEIASGTETREVVCRALVEELSAGDAQHPAQATGLGYSYCVGKYGPCLRENLPDGKVKFHKLKPNVTKAMVDASEDPSEFALVDVEIGKHGGKAVVLKTGKYGQYIECGSVRTSWSGEGKPELSEAVALLDAKVEGPLRVLSPEWKIKKGVKGRPDYAEKARPGRAKPVRLSMVRYPGNFLTDPNATVLEWINNAHNV